ncbi:MAG: helix-turn-helix transcriptional regulator [Verrucomicrobiota bacterium]|nr:helix-turn-helix transcriptional regulator [Verrucomicrobiota bacterium]
MASIGDQLQRAREAQGLSVAEVVDQTKLMTDQIHALEAGNWGAFAAPVYMRGFVRNYAGLLKLDVEEVMKGLEVELGQVKPDDIGENGEAPLRSGLLDGVMLHFSGVRWRAVIPVFLVVGLAVGVYLGREEWRKYKSNDPLEALGSGLNEESLVTSADQLPIESPDSGSAPSQ